MKYFPNRSSNAPTANILNVTQLIESIQFDFLAHKINLSLLV